MPARGSTALPASRRRHRHRRAAAEHDIEAGLAVGRCGECVGGGAGDGVGAAGREAFEAEGLAAVAGAGVEDEPQVVAVADGLRDEHCRVAGGFEHRAGT